jgi:hypothetical protein
MKYLPDRLAVRGNIEIPLNIKFPPVNEGTRGGAVG